MTLGVIDEDGYTVNMEREPVKIDDSVARILQTKMSECRRSVTLRDVWLTDDDGSQTRHENVEAWVVEGTNAATLALGRALYDEREKQMRRNNNRVVTGDVQEALKQDQAKVRLGIAKVYAEAERTAPVKNSWRS